MIFSWSSRISGLHSIGYTYTDHIIRRLKQNRQNTIVVKNDLQQTRHGSE